MAEFRETWASVVAQSHTAAGLMDSMWLLRLDEFCLKLLELHFNHLQVAGNAKRQAGSSAMHLIDSLLPVPLPLPLLLLQLRLVNAACGVACHKQQ